MGLLAESMSFIIIIAAVIEGYLFHSVKQKCKTQQRSIHDTFLNIVKGISHTPDQNSNQSDHDNFVSLVTFLERKIANRDKDAEILKRNITRHLEKNTKSETFEIESLFNMCSAMVQVFPLLGILGTILALSQVASDSGAALQASEVTTAFVIAIDTTILGMFFAIVFTLQEARVLARVKRILDDSTKANNFIISVLS